MTESNPEFYTGRFEDILYDLENKYGSGVDFRILEGIIKDKLISERNNNTRR